MSDSQIMRHNLNSVTAPVADGYINALKYCGEFAFKTYLPTDDKCHFERYSFTHAAGKLGIVYDTKAEIFSLSAKGDVIDRALKVMGVKECARDSLKSIQECASDNSAAQAELPVRAGEKTDGASKSKQAKSDKQKSAKADKQKSEQAAVKSADNTKAKSRENSADAKVAVKSSKQSARPKKEQTKTEKSPGNKNTAQKSAEVAVEAPEYKDGFSLKKCPRERFDGFLKRIRALKDVSVTASGDKQLAVYKITDSGQQKCILRYVPAKQSVQLQGKRSNIFAQVQVILCSDSGFNQAVGSHMELTGDTTRTSSVQRSLKKLLPDAFDLLSEQSKIDIGIGMVDIGNPEVKLSDYSVLLVPPYRGLERFIFDLQKAREISVKMIGQAYEKDEAGRHCLKAVYAKRVGIVYTEVMNALYAEYFERRNFYAHSDNTDAGQSRMIADKAAAQSIFEGLCKVINYNAKKLKEIGFTVSR